MQEQDSSQGELVENTKQIAFIDVKLIKASHSKRLVVLLGFCLIALAVFTSALVLLFKFIIFFLVLLIGAISQKLSCCYRLRFYQDYWLVEKDVETDQSQSFYMQLLSINNFVFCKCLYFVGEDVKPIKINIFKDQVSENTWRKLSVLSNFEQQSNNFY